MSNGFIHQILFIGDDPDTVKQTSYNRGTTQDLSIVDLKKLNRPTFAIDLIDLIGL